MKVYLVIGGDYDGGIICACSTQENAEMIVEHLDAAVKQVDFTAYEIDEFVERYKAGLKYYIGYMNKIGASYYVRERAPDNDEGCLLIKSSNEMRFLFWAHDEPEAVKLADAKRLELVESGEWI